jgi:hypothetical protein
LETGKKLNLTLGLELADLLFAVNFYLIIQRTLPLLTYGKSREE